VERQRPTTVAVIELGAIGVIIPIDTWTDSRSRRRLGAAGDG
jgi:hypothetical protein